MITLVATNESLKITTSSAADVSYYASYNELAVPSLASANPSSAVGVISAAATNIIVGAPAAGYIRQIKGVYLVNVHATDPVDVTVSKDAATTLYRLHPTFTLAAGEGASYIEGAGWTLYNANGTRKADA